MPATKRDYRVDTRSATVHDVALWKPKSKNGYVYSRDFARELKAQAEGGTVKLDHGDGVAEEANGSTKNLRWFVPTTGVVSTEEPEEKVQAWLIGDWQLNPHHRTTQQFLHDADNAPRNLKLSQEIAEQGWEERRGENQGRVITKLKPDGFLWFSVVGVEGGFFRGLREELHNSFGDDEMTTPAINTLSDLRAQYPALMELAGNEHDKQFAARLTEACGCDSIDALKARIAELESENTDLKAKIAAHSKAELLQEYWDRQTADLDETVKVDVSSRVDIGRLTDLPTEHAKGAIDTAIAGAHALSKVLAESKLSDDKRKRLFEKPPAKKKEEKTGDNDVDADLDEWAAAFGT